MQQLVVFAALLGCAFANILGHAPAHVVPGPTVLTKNIHHVEQVHPVQHVQRTVVPVHHPPVSTVHHAPDAILAKAPRIHGYAYTSEVKHDAPVAVAHAAPVVAHAAPVVAHAAPVVGHAAPVVGHGYGLAAPIAAPVLGIGAGLAGGIGYGHGHVAKAPIVTGGHIVKVGAVPAEHPQVSSYAIETGRTHVAQQAHYGVGYSHGVVNVPAVKTVAQAVTHVAHAPVVSHVAHAPVVAHGVKGLY